MSSHALSPLDNANSPSILSLPNETLYQIVFFLAGEPTLNPHRRPTPRYNNVLCTIGLVNKRLLSIARTHAYFRHQITSERQLQEHHALTEEERIKRTYTRQLEVDGLPISYYLDEMATLYPSVTHLTLTNVRTTHSGADSIPQLSSVRQLSIQTSILNEAGIPQLLRSFPNLEVLVLDSDHNTYKMETKFLLSFPPMPKLRVLYRPPLRHTYLHFAWLQPYSRMHEHSASHYEPTCRGCQSWCQRTNSSEACSVIELAWHFPSLREVFIPRLVIENFTVIPACPSREPRHPVEIDEYADWIERVRSEPDVAIWLIEESQSCSPDHKSTSVATAATSGQAIMHTPDIDKDKSTKRPSFQVMQPLTLYMQNARKRSHARQYMRYPKFWWSEREDRIAGCERVEPSEEQPLCSENSEPNPRVLSAWDL